MIDLVLQIETIARGGQPAWRVQIGTAREFISPLTDDDLRRAVEAMTPAGHPPALPPIASTWDGLLAHLGPNERCRINARGLELVGRLIHDHLIRGKIAEHVTRIETNARAQRRPLRYVVHVFEGEEDGLLRRLPFELLHHGSFWFRRTNTVGIRLPAVSEACDVRLEPGASVLIAAAHADDRDPSANQLAAHVEAVTQLVERAGFRARALTDCTPEALKSALQERCDVLYVVCHGEEDLDLHGRLVLRGGDITGRQLGEWLEAASESGHRTQAAILCACSSAIPGRRPGTMGMAEHLAATGRRASAALGFRAPVKVTWALTFTTEVFTQLAAGKSFEVAVAAARREQSIDDSQWALPLMFAHERDPFGIAPAAVPRHYDLSEIQSLLPTTPRPYFTARQHELEILHAWRASSKGGTHAVLVGEGGVGKSEIARKLAHEVYDTGVPVIWIERPDADLGGCLTTMIQRRDPAYRPRQGATLDDVRADLTRILGPYGGMLVLDDVEHASTVDSLTPGIRWKVLVTTRRRALIPGASEIDVDPMDPNDALTLLEKLAREGEPFPPDESAAARDFVEVLAYLPLAIELTSAQVRRGATLEEMRQAVLSNDDNNSVLPHVGRIMGRIMDRSLAPLEVGDEAAWTLMAALPDAGVTANDIAVGLDETAGRGDRRLFRLRQANLVRFQTKTRRYVIHPLARQIARFRAQATRTWGDTLARASKVASELANAHMQQGTKLLKQGDSELALAEFHIAFDHLGDASDRLAKALDEHTPDWVLKARAAVAHMDAALTQPFPIIDDSTSGRILVGYLYLARALFQRVNGRDDLSESDCERAIDLFSAAQDNPCLAAAHRMRGNLRRSRGAFLEAGADFSRAFELFALGGNLRRRLEMEQAMAQLRAIAAPAG